MTAPGASDRTVQAGYVEAGWVANGEGRAYRPTTAAAPECAIDLRSGVVGGVADDTRAHADPSASSVTGRALDADLVVGRLQVA